MKERGDPLWWGQSSSSLALSVIKTEVPLDCDDPANQDLLLQQYGERIEKLSQPDKLSKILNGFWISECCWNLDNTSRRKTLEISHNFMQWPVENTLFQEKKKHHDQKNGSKGTQRLGPYQKLQPVTCMVSMELRSEFGLWTQTTLTPGSEFLMDQIGLWWIWTTMTTEIPEVQLEEYALKLDAKDCACRSKAKAKTTKKRTCRLFTKNSSFWEEELGLMLKQGSDYEVSKKVMYLLRHSQHVHREKKKEQFNSGELRKIFQKHFPHPLIGLITSGKHVWQEEEEIRKDSSTVLIPQEQMCISELFKDFQDAILLILLFQDNVIIQSNFFQYIFHVGCALNLHSDHHFGINTGRSKLEQKTDSILSACWSYGQKSQGSWCDRLECAASCTIHA